MVATYMESLLNTKSAPDDHSDILYRVLTWRLDYTEDLFKDECAPDGHSYSLYRVLTLMSRPTQRYSLKMEALLKITLTAYIGSSPWQLRPTRSHNSMMETLMIVATYTESLLNDGSALDGHLKSYIGPPSWRLRLIWSHSWITKALLMVPTYTESLLNDESDPDGHSNSLY